MMTNPEDYTILEAVVEAVKQEPAQSVMDELSPGIFPVVGGRPLYGVAIPSVGNPWHAAQEAVKVIRPVLGLPKLDGVVITIAQNYVVLDDETAEEKMVEMQAAAQEDDTSLNAMADGLVMTFTAATSTNGIQTALIPLSRGDDGELTFNDDTTYNNMITNENGFSHDHPIFNIQSWVLFGQKEEADA